MTVAGAVVLHLGTLDESVVRPKDIYLCVRPNRTSRCPEFALGWYSQQTGRVSFRPLDSDCISGASLGPLALEAMLAEELPQLLQTLLVGVERVICRLPLDDLSFPTSSYNDTHKLLVSSDNATADTPPSIISSSSTGHDDEELAEVESGGHRRPLESGLKRRELITKNKMMGTKYALLRAIKSEKTSSAQSSCPGQQAPLAEVNAMYAMADEGGGAEGFGLGGGLAFPHIDSDEESADEATKRSGSGQGKWRRFQILIVSDDCSDNKPITWQRNVSCDQTAVCSCRER